MIYKTIDLCAGIGGIRRGFEMTGLFENVLSAEIDPYAALTYKHLFGEDPTNDLTSEDFKNEVVNTEYDVLLAGFPCQAFSRVGKQLGFRDTTRGTIFFDIADIISRTNPRAVFLENVEKKNYICTLSAEEKMIIEYLSKTILSGVRPEELEILRLLLEQKSISINDFKRFVNEKYDRNITNNQVDYAIDVLQGKFVSNDNEYQKYKNIEVITNDHNNFITRMLCYEERLRHDEFRQMVEDIVQVGLTRYEDKFMKTDEIESPFVLYEKYSRRDVSLLMNCGKDLSSVMFGMKRIVDDVFIFVTYHKEKSDDDRNYVDGKPDYADAFEDNMIFRWDSKIGMGIESNYMKEVTTAPRKHLLVKKSDAESNFYYMGTFDILDVKEDQKEDNKGILKKICKVVVKMHHPVRDDLLCYLQSTIKEN